MSKPRGKAVQRRLSELAKEILEPWGFSLTVDFSKRGGHQKLLVDHPALNTTISLELPSSPRCDEHAMDFMRQRCKRIIRDLTGGNPPAKPDKGSPPLRYSARSA